MTVKVSINGFGRIGRGFMRAASGYKDFEIVAINDLADEKTNAYLLKYDTVSGKFDGTVDYGDGFIKVNGREIKVYRERDPEKLPWKELGVDLAIECTGLFRTEETAGKHITAGAKKVVLSAPGKGGDILTIVPGVNDRHYDPERHKIISNASCTTNCLAPMVKVLDEAFGINSGLMTTIHAVTNDQRMLDVVHSDLRRARAGCWNIIPTTTGAAKAISQVYPPAAGKLTGMAVRVPVMDVSLVDLNVTLTKAVTSEEVNAAFKAASEGDLKEYVEYIDEPLVSSDFIGNDHSCIFDSIATLTIGNMAKVLGWYDNEGGYSQRLADLTAIVAKSL
ncbi:MAG: type I glyceraldehyde-3-phosphate dehydrogenase [Candidatus Thorarchaeota archaeon]|nr:MAG: type I glyceraldehyde-3-phosphate dehydrogenase [Candidatus Thorarchaeota archaeon]